MIKKVFFILLSGMSLSYGQSNEVASKCAFVKQDLPIEKVSGITNITEGLTLNSKSGALKLVFGPEVNDNSHALVIKNLKNGSSCSTIDLGWESLYLSSDDRTILAEAEHMRYFFDTKTCKVKMPTEIFYGALETKGESAVWSGDCGYCNGSKCTCWPVAVYEMDQQCNPVLDQKKSFKLTEELYGVGFSGRSLVEFPKSNHAKVLEQFSQ